MLNVPRVRQTRNDSIINESETASCRRRRRVLGIWWKVYVLAMDRVL